MTRYIRKMDTGYSKRIVEPIKCTAICHQHSKTEDYQAPLSSDRCRLKDSSIPAIFNFSYLTKQTKENRKVLQCSSPAEKICIPTLPTNLCLKSKEHPVGGYEVCSVKDIPIGIKFGPYEDIFIDYMEQDNKKDFQLQVEKKGENMMSDRNNEKQFSWLRYVNYACSKEEQNLIAVQHNSQAYYITCKFVPANTELLVWYQDFVSKDETRYINCNNQFEEATDVHSMKIIPSDIAQNKNENTLNFEKIQFISSRNDDICRNVIKHAELFNILDSSEKTTAFLCNKFHKPIYNQENTFICKEKSVQTNYEKSRNNFKKTDNLCSLESNDANEKSRDFEKCENEFRIYTKVKFNETNPATEFTNERYESVNKLTHGNRLNEPKRIDETANLYEDNGVEEGFIYPRELNTLLQNYSKGKSYESEIVANHGNFILYEQVHNEDNPCKYETKLTQNNTLIMKKSIGTCDMKYNLCEKKFKTNKKLKKDQERHQGEETYKCNACDKEFQTGSELTNHEKIHSKKHYEHNVCSETFAQTSGLIDRKNIHSSEKTYNCNICEKPFTRRFCLMRHKMIHTGEKPYKCNICLKNFIDRSQLIQHERIHTGEKPYKCNICRKEFTEKSNLTKHQRIHTGKKPYKCNICLKNFIQRSHLMHHERIHIGDEFYKCNICLKNFFQRTSLIQHERIHTGEKPYKCNICRKTFTKKSSLTKHGRVHSGEKPYKCNICLKNFIQRSNLVYHERIHTGEKPYQCSICKKAFTEKSNLAKHQRIHTGEKPYKCNICLKNFIQRSHLIHHERIHTGEKPYICNICGKAFTAKSKLTKHQKIHAEEKWFKCNVCGSEFAGKSNLIKHSKTHTEPKSYKCDVCLKNFTHISNLIRHEISHIRKKASNPIYVEKSLLKAT